MRELSVDNENEEVEESSPFLKRSGDKKDEN
jgi:hypothetical protein